jgi:hypothetical protein
MVAASSCAVTKMLGMSRLSRIVRAALMPELARARRMSIRINSGLCCSAIRTAAEAVEATSQI